MIDYKKLFWVSLRCYFAPLIGAYKAAKAELAQDTKPSLRGVCAPFIGACDAVKAEMARMDREHGGY